MTIIFIIKDLDSVYIMIIDLYRFSINREILEIQEENDYLEDCDCEPMDVDNYYLDQEYWFEGDE